MTDTETLLDGAQQVVLAIDLGGTKLETALIARTGDVIPASRTREETGADISPDRLSAALRRSTQHSLAAMPTGATLTGIGVASAGPIDHRSGTVSPVNMTRLGGSYPLVDVVRNASRCPDAPLLLGHDGGCLAMAEHWLGSTRNVETSMTFVVSTGIGGGIVHRGDLFGGATGNAGHLGQMAVGNSTLEELASGPASIRWAATHGWSGATGQQLAADAAAGDEIARAAIVRSATYVGTALASVAALVDVGRFAIGGGFARVSDDYVAIVERELHRSAPLPHLAHVPVTPSALGSDGPLLGAASLILRSRPDRRVGPESPSET